MCVPRWKATLQLLACAFAAVVGAVGAEQLAHLRSAGPRAGRARAASVAAPAPPPSSSQRLEDEGEDPPAEVDEPDMVFSPDEVRTAHAVGRHLRSGRVITGATSNRLILFTFDDGPDRRTTPRLLRYLDEADVRAVFFVTTSKVTGPGARARAQAELLREIVRRGHMVGNHTHEHQPLPLIDTPAVIAEIDRAQEAIETILGERPYLFRPPGGTRSPRVDRLIAERGYTQVLWNVGTGDFQVRSADDVVRLWSRILERRERENGERGGIVLLHDTHPWSVEAFPRIVAEIRRRNCELLDRGEELFDIVDDPALFFAAREGADPSSEAPPLTLPAEMLAERQRRLRLRAERRCHATVARR